MFFSNIASDYSLSTALQKNTLKGDSGNARVFVQSSFIMTFRRNCNLIDKFPFLFLALIVSLPTNTFATDSDPQLKTDSKSNKIDWSKPVVSRGFGLESSSADISKTALQQYKSGQVFYFFGEYKNAINRWLPLLEVDFPEAETSMGWIYQAGLGVEKDEARAFDLYSKAALKNNAIAQNNLGVMYENGIQIASNKKTARQLYKQSAENGYRFGQYNYANLLLDTAAGKVDRQAAMYWYLESAKQNVKQAKNKLDAMRAEN